MIAIIDYGVGNLASVQKAMAAIDQPAEITGDPERIAKADRLILPGVGAFATGMANLSSRGLVEPVQAHVASGRPLLGICLGLQLLMEESEELAPDGTRPRGLGIFAGTVRLLPGPGKVPQIGWNTLRSNPGHPSLGPYDGQYVYFVHSYYADPEDRSLIAAETTYGVTFAAALGRGRVLAVQFHPEKSGAVGLSILRTFCETP